MIQNLTPLQIKEILESGEKIRLIDVREEWEYKIAKIPGSELMPLSRFVEFIPSLDPKDKIIVYCHKGVRSLNVCYYLFNAGFDRIINLNGGIDAWVDEIDNSISKY